MSAAWVAVLALVVPVPHESGVTALDCPARQTTRIVFPEALRTLRIDARAKAALGLVVERSAPSGLLIARPPRAGAEAFVDFEGPTLTLRLHLRATAAGTGGEIRLARAADLAAPPVLALPAVTPTPGPTSTPAPVALSTAATAAPPAPAAPATEVAELLRAETIAVGRREGLPGESEMVLVDALNGRSSVWLRFLLERGAAETVETVTWEKGRATDVVAEPVGKDLRIVAALPREALGRRSLVSVRVGGRTYDFSFSTPPFRALLKALER